MLTTGTTHARPASLAIVGVILLARASLAIAGVLSSFGGVDETRTSPTSTTRARSPRATSTTGHGRRVAAAARAEEADAAAEARQPQYDAVKQQVMQFLVSAEVDRGRGQGARPERDRRRGQAAVRADQGPVFPNEKAYQRFLKTSGQTEAGPALPRPARRALEQDPPAGHRRAARTSPTARSRTTTTRTSSSSRSPSGATSR